jgi:hypothetical protein
MTMKSVPPLNVLVREQAAKALLKTGELIETKRKQTSHPVS